MENKFWFLTKHSLFKKLKDKWFLIINIIMFIVVIGLVNINQIVNFFGGDFNKPTKIKIIDKIDRYDLISTELNNNFKLLNSKFKIIKEDKDIKHAKNNIKGTKDILIVLTNDDSNIFKAELISDKYIDTIKMQSILSSLNNVKKNIALENEGINKDKLLDINKSVEIKRTLLDDSKSKEEELSKSIMQIISLIFVMPCFMLIISLVQMIGAEINEEKSTRSMEIIIGNVSPKTHFFSKVLSSNLFVLIQSVLFIIYGVIGFIIKKLISPKSIISSLEIVSGANLTNITDVINTSGIINKLGYVIPLIIILIILTFLAYSLLAGILASMTTNMENFQQLQTPLMLISILGVYIMIVSNMFPGSTFIKVLSVIPLLSITLAPSLILTGEIGVSLLILAIVILIILNVILVKYGLRIYKVGILNYSESNLWKKIFKAAKEK